MDLQKFNKVMENLSNATDEDINEAYKFVYKACEDGVISKHEGKIFTPRIIGEAERRKYHYE